HRTAMTVGLDALAVENGGGWPRAFALGSSDECAQRVVEHGPLVVKRPLPEDMIDGLPWRKAGGQITPRAATLDDIQDGIQDAPPVTGRAAAFSAFGEHRLEVSPLGVRETGVIGGVFHASTEAALNIGRQIPSRMSTYSFINPSLATKPIIQTAT